MSNNLADELGFFTVFGFSQTQEKLDRLSRRLGVQLQRIAFGDWGHFFFYSSYGDVEETQEVIALKLGFVRSPSAAPLSTAQLLAHKLVSPQAIAHTAFRGNALVACLSKKEARFCVYQTLLSPYQLHYAASGQDVVCSDSLRCLMAALDRVELDESRIPWHFTLFHMPGQYTLLRDVYRLLPGEILKWQNGQPATHLARDLRFSDNGPQYTSNSDRAINATYRRFGEIMAAYLQDIRDSGQGSVGNLLSGGIDSSYLQFLITEQSPPPHRSFSYAARTPCFEFEIEYARQASQALGTAHTFVDITVQDFPGLLNRTTEALAQPILSDPEPNKLGLVEYLARHAPDLHFFVNGNGTGSLFGNSSSGKHKILSIAAQIPAAGHALRIGGKLLEPFFPNAPSLLKAADMLAQIDNWDSFDNPVNTRGARWEYDKPRRVFGDRVILEALKQRFLLEAQFLKSPYLMERMSTVTLLTYNYEVATQSQRIFLSQRKEIIFPYMDEDGIRLALAFHPRVRYARNLTDKYILRRILNRRTALTIGIGHKPKGGSVVFNDLCQWMEAGPLHEMVRAIERPAFLSRQDFENAIQCPGLFLWSLLTFDLFKKRVLNRAEPL